MSDTTRHQLLMGFPQIRDLRVLARQQGTVDNWTDIALEWMAQADAEISRLKALVPVNTQKASISEELPNFSTVKDLIDTGISDLEIRLISLALSVAALPEASTIDNFEAKRLLDVVIRDANNALELELTHKQRKFQNILATVRSMKAGGMAVDHVNQLIWNVVNLLQLQAFGLSLEERKDLDYALSLLRAYSAEITEAGPPEHKHSQVR